MKQGKYYWEWSNVYKDVSEIDDETRQINIMREKLVNIPSWASEIRQQITCISPCGHYSFPEQIDLIYRGIGNKKPAPNFRGCYQVSRAVKVRMKDYLFGLAAWLSSKDVNAVIAEKPSSEALITKIYSLLGDQNEVKGLLVKRLIKRHEWWLKVISQNTWRTRKNPYSWYNEPEGVDLFSDECKNSEIRLLEEKIRERLKDASEIFLKHIHHSWLCHYKAFRHIDIAIQSIGYGKWGADIIRDGLDRKRMVGLRNKYIACFDCWLKKKDVTEVISKIENSNKFIETTYSALGEQGNISMWLVSALRKTIKIFRDRQKGNS